MSKKGLKFPKLLAGKISLDVRRALDKFIKDKQRDDPSYNDADFLRRYVVEILQREGYMPKRRKSARS